MSTSITGPNCIDPSICHSDCCHIQIDVPLILVEFYLDHRYAQKEDFIRGDVFSFKIAVNISNSKCIFYDKEINGCKLHTTGMKPPQCWIYPTGFSNQPGESKQFANDGTIKCKKVSGWWIQNEFKTSEASIILQEYVKYCENEFIEQNSGENIEKRLRLIREKFTQFGPTEIAGIIDGYDNFEILLADGISLKIKKICDQNEKSKNNCDPMRCSHICTEVASKLTENLKKQIIKTIQQHGAKEKYSFQELWNE
jgi:Fe-S-cluster containining protein